MPDESIAFRPASALLTAGLAPLLNNMWVKQMDRRNQTDGSLRDRLTNAALKTKARLAGYEPVTTKSNNPTAAFAGGVNMENIRKLKTVPDSNRVLATSQNSGPGITAHELGHALQPDWLRMPKLYGASGKLPIPLAVLSALSRNPETARRWAGYSALSAVPALAAEVDASYRGSKELNSLGYKHPMEAWSGVPTYLLTGMGPALAATLSRKLPL